MNETTKLPEDVKRTAEAPFAARNGSAYTVGDTIRIWTGTRYSVWKITGIHLGALAQEGLVSLKCLDQKPGCAFGKTGDSIVPHDLLWTHPHVERV